MAEPEHNSEVAQLIQHITHEYNASRNDIHRVAYETPPYYTSNTKMECWLDLKDALASRIGTVPETIANYGIATFRAISCLFREGHPHRIHCKILYTL